MVLFQPSLLLLVFFSGHFDDTLKRSSSKLKVYHKKRYQSGNQVQQCHFFDPMNKGLDAKVPPCKCFTFVGLAVDAELIVKRR